MKFFRELKVSHLARRPWRRLAALAFATGVLAAMPLYQGEAQAQAQENTVSVAFTESGLETEARQRDYEDLKVLLLEETASTLSHRYTIVEGTENAQYDIHYELRPLAGDNWMLKCSWSSDVESERQKCWSKTYTLVRYFPGMVPSEIFKVGCAVDFINLSATQPPKLPDNPCAPKAPESEKTVKTVFMRCFTVSLQDQQLQQQIQIKTNSLPLLVSRELDDLFLEKGYHIKPEKCGVDGDGGAQDEAIEVIGYIEEEGTQQRNLYGNIFVELSETGTASDEFIRSIEGETERVTRDEIDNIREKIITHFRERVSHAN